MIYSLAAEKASDSFGVLAFEHGVAIHPTPTPGCLLVSIVNAPGIAVLDLSRSRHLEPLRRAFVCFLFGHDVLLLGRCLSAVVFSWLIFVECCAPDFEGGEPLRFR